MTAVVVTAAVTLWAGVRWPLALAVAVAAGLVVAVAAVLAATVPAPHRPATTGQAVDGSDSDDAVQ